MCFSYEGIKVICMTRKWNLHCYTSFCYSLWICQPKKNNVKYLHNLVVGVSYSMIKGSLGKFDPKIDEEIVWDMDYC